MANKLSNKVTALIMALALVLSCLIPITTVFVIGASINYRVSSNMDGIADIAIEREHLNTSGEGYITIDDKGSYTLEIATEMKMIEEVKVNNAVLTPTHHQEDPNGVLNKYSIPFATSYSIEVTLAEYSSPKGNIVWCTSEKACLDKGYIDPQGKADAVVEHGTVEIVSIKTKNGVLTREELEEKRFEDGWFEFKDGVGYAEIMAGAEVKVKFIPDYGYQLTKMQINDTEFKAENEQSTFTFEMARGPLHLSALFTKVDDVVKSSTSKVTSGTVKIGSNEINTGSTVLSVKDATLTDEQKAAFNTKAGDYKVSNVFDIKLDQVVYKGTADDVWSNPLGYSEDLQSPAVITLKLDEGVDGNTVVLIHEKEGGTYETIDTTYDAAAHTITFSTNSFSNYAIASKTVVGPKTGDSNSLYAFLLLGLVAAAEAVVLAMRRRKEN